MPRVPLPCGPLVVVVLAGCPSAEDKCEKARDAWMEMWNASAKAALATVDDAQEKARLTREAEAEIARGREIFVRECTALPKVQLACIARTDEMLELERARRAATEACALGDPTCAEKARADFDRQAEAKLGSICVTTFERFGQRLGDLAADPK